MYVVKPTFSGVFHLKSLFLCISLLVQRILIAKLSNLCLNILFLILKVSSCQPDALCNLWHILIPLSLLVVTAGVPMRTPEVTNGLLGSFGTVFLFKVINTSSQRFCSSLPEISIPRRSNSIRWLSVPPVRILKPCFCSASASAFAFNTT